MTPPTVTAAQLREVVDRLITAGHWRPGDPDILIVADAGYDGPRLAFLLADLPVRILVRMRSDRVLRRPAPPRHARHAGPATAHGGEFAFGDPATWGEPDTRTRTDTRLYGTATARSWDRLHPRLTHRVAWMAHAEQLPIIEGTVIRLQVERLPSGAIPKPVWLWCSAHRRHDGRWWIGCGRRSCAGSISSTPSACSSRPWAGPRPKLRDPAGGGSVDLADPRRLHPATPGPPSERSICAVRGRNHGLPIDCPRHGSATGFGTCVRRPVFRPEHRNPLDPVQDDQSESATTSRPSVMTCTSSGRPHQRRRRRARPDHAKQVKTQASHGSDRPRAGTGCG